MDRLAHFDIKIKQIAGKHLVLTDYLRRNPISKLELIENYEEEYVRNCMIPLLEFSNTHGSITGPRTEEIQTDQDEQRDQKNDKSEERCKIERKSKDDQQNKHSALLRKQNTVKHVNEQTQMDLRRTEQIEEEDPSEESSELTSCWKDLTKPGDYRLSKGVWKQFNPHQHHRLEINRIERE